MRSSDYLASAQKLASEMSPEVKAGIAAGLGAEALDDRSAEAYRAHLRAHGQRVMGFDLSNATYLEDADRAYLAVR